MIKFLSVVASAGLIAYFALAKSSVEDSLPKGMQSVKAEQPTYTSQDPLIESMKLGAQVYTEYCIQCHLGEGEGVPGTFPPLAKSDWLTPEKREAAIRVVKYGQSGEIQVNGVSYNSAMAELGLYDDEVANVMNYILNNWGNSSEAIVTEEEVKKIGRE